jgi:hypothetical protein
MVKSAESPLKPLAVPATITISSTSVTTTNLTAPAIKASSSSSSSSTTPTTTKKQLAANAEYDEYLRQAKLADFSHVEPLNIIYRAGVDVQGRPVIVVVAAHLPAKSVDLKVRQRNRNAIDVLVVQMVLLLAMSVLDPIGL